MGTGKPWGAHPLGGNLRGLPGTIRESVDRMGGGGNPLGKWYKVLRGGAPVSEEEVLRVHPVHCVKGKSTTGKIFW